MIRPPTRSPLTYTLFPYTTLVRSDVVLHVDLDLDDVFVGGQDRHVVAEGLDLGGGDLGHALDRPRQLEVRAGLEDPRELAEAQHHAAFLLGDQHETVEGQPQHQRQADPAQRVAATAVEHAAEVVEQAAEAASIAAAAAPRFPWVATVLSGPAVIVLAGNVPGHATSTRGCAAATWATACGTGDKVGRAAPGRSAARPHQPD